MKSKLAVLLLSSLALCGCVPLQRAMDTASTPYTEIDTDPDTPGTQPPLNRPGSPADDLLEGVPRVIVAPWDLSAWLKLIGAAAVIVAGGAGAYKLNRKLRRKE